MGKFIEPTDDIVEIVKQLTDELNLGFYGLEVQPLCVTKASKVCEVVKANDLTEYKLQKDNLIFVLCYEAAFNGRDRNGSPFVEDDVKRMWIQNAMECISYDSEKDKLSLKAPTLQIPVSFYEKYGEKAIDSARLGLYVMSQIADLKKQEAAEKKNKKVKHKQDQQAD